jgi:uncharacterized GH25 family protein
MRFVALACLFVAASAPAHDAYVDRDQRVVFGHPGVLEAYPADKLTAVTVLDAAGGRIAHRVERVDEISVIRADRAAVITVEFDNGLFAKTPDAGKFVPGGRDLHPDATEVRRFVKFGKSLYGWSGPALLPHGQRLEIVPTGKPAAGRLPVVVHFDGKPIAGAAIKREDGDQSAAQTTDANGAAVLPFDAGSEQLYTARHDIPGADGVDRIGLAAALYVPDKR